MRIIATTIRASNPSALVIRGMVYCTTIHAWHHGLFRHLRVQIQKLMGEPASITAGSVRYITGEGVQPIYQPTTTEICTHAHHTHKDVVAHHCTSIHHLSFLPSYHSLIADTFNSQAFHYHPTFIILVVIVIFGFIMLLPDISIHTSSEKDGVSGTAHNCTRGGYIAILPITMSASAVSSNMMDEHYTEADHGEDTAIHSYTSTEHEGLQWNPAFEGMLF
ncbi:predicted protein [Lichtheimia corymbifera JMRC:FSU:9682]|uniref:Uncharacterized protein n=1 Tax=Lichtheimia corymbifera JMRC:FSU:9682 TaxID=1263082 RepID=A0A068RJS5_9FUNG|nr:predicted protein [Lichtheimia corymbifera JMRC:FSU:9682]